MNENELSKANWNWCKLHCRRMHMFFSLLSVFYICSRELSVHITTICEYYFRGKQIFLCCHSYHLCVVIFFFQLNYSQCSEIAILNWKTGSFSFNWAVIHFFTILCAAISFVRAFAHSLLFSFTARDWNTSPVIVSSHNNIIFYWRCILVYRRII